MRTGQNSGVTLIEIILAVYILAIVFAALAAVYPAVYRHSALSGNRFLAVRVSENIIETVKAVPWGKPVTPFIRKDQHFSRLIDGSRQISIFKVRKISFDPPNATGDGPDPKSRSALVTVTIEWIEGTGKSSEAVTQTYTTQGTITHN